MSKEFDTFPNLIAFQDFICQVFTEAIRILKPGGHGLVWAIPRTSHHTAMGLERAGFEIRDCVYHIFGSGFPKSLDISKAIDEMKDTKRKIKFEIIKQEENLFEKEKILKRKKTKKAGMGTGKSFGILQTEGTNSDRNTPRKVNLTIPATPEAKQWDGWGSALKPAVECWWLIRKPISEKTIAENVLKWGIGGINIDECRIGKEKISVHGYKGYGCFGIGGKGEYGTKEMRPSYQEKQGRFPANLVLSCICDEVKEGKKITNKAIRHNSGGNTFGGENKKPPMEDLGYTDKVIIHTNPKCPCYILDKQSGNRPSGGGEKRGKSYAYFHKTTENKQNIKYNCEASQGGASRFFYCAKPSKSEKNEGLNFNPIDNTDKYQGKFPNSKADKNNINKHPTVKPLALMRYLIKLITPPKGTVIDMFMGSGSTLVACEQLGFNGIGVEKDKEYFEIARARIEQAQKQLKLF